MRTLLCFVWFLISVTVFGADKPNILVMVADDLGYADVGFNGGKVIATPNLDRLAATGVKLTDFRSCPMCSPTRAGLMTGRWPARFGMMRSVVPPWSKYGLPPEEKTLPEWLASAGYERRGMVGKWHLGHAERKNLPLANGFTRFYGHYNGAIHYFTHERDGELDWHDDDRPLRQPGYATDLLGAEAARFIREAPGAEPWFLYVPFNAPHSPFQAKPDDLKKYSGIRDADRRAYAAMVDCMDQAIGKIIEAVESRADADNTLVLFMSDNGGILRVGSNGPWRGEKLTVYEGGTRVCAVMRWPRGQVAGGKQFDGRIGYIDVLPTLLAAAGVKNPANVDGIDFLPAIRKGTRLPKRPWFSYMHQSDEAHASVHLEQWKLVAHGDFFAKNPVTPPKLELYNLDKDSAETTDVAGANPKVVKKLAKQLREFGTWRRPGVGAYEEGRAGYKPPKDWIIQH